LFYTHSIQQGSGCFYQGGFEHCQPAVAKRQNIDLQGYYNRNPIGQQFGSVFRHNCAKDE
jgi:hypothetical protein